MIGFKILKKHQQIQRSNNLLCKRSLPLFSVRNIGNRKNKYNIKRQ